MKKIIHLLKLPIMAIASTMKLIPIAPKYDSGLMLYVAFIIPFSPIIIYTLSINNEEVLIWMMFYFFFYLIANIVIGQIIKKVVKKWTRKEFQSLSIDNVTFLSILLLAINAGLHFGLFYCFIASISIVK